MSQTLLFSIGLGVFTITLVATLLYGYLALDRVYQADSAERPVPYERVPGPSTDRAPEGLAVFAVPASLPD